MIEPVGTSNMASAVDTTGRTSRLARELATVGQDIPSASVSAPSISAPFASYIGGRVGTSVEVGTSVTSREPSPERMGFRFADSWSPVATCPSLKAHIGHSHRQKIALGTRTPFLLGLKTRIFVSFSVLAFLPLELVPLASCSSCPVKWYSRREIKDVNSLSGPHVTVGPIMSSPSTSARSAAVRPRVPVGSAFKSAADMSEYG